MTNEAAERLRSYLANLTSKTVHGVAWLDALDTALEGERKAVRDYVEQRKWDSWIDDEEAQSLPVADVNRALGEYRAYLDVLHFLNGSYRPDYLEAVAERSERRKLVGPR